MNDLTTMLRQIRRPRLLVRAARLGRAGYRRERDLCRLLGVPCPPPPGRAVMTLISMERAEEEKRKAGDPSYRAARHVEILIALGAEAKGLGTIGPGRSPAQMNASGSDAFLRAT